MVTTSATTVLPGRASGHRRLSVGLKHLQVAGGGFLLSQAGTCCKGSVLEALRNCEYG
jgi:hypothetical protein